MNTLHAQRFRNLLLILLLLAAGVFSVLYVWSQQRTTKQVAQPSTDLVALSRHVELPEAPRRAVFALIPMGTGGGFIGPTDYTLIALLTYDESATQRLKAKVTRVNRPTHTGYLPERPTWFPQSLLAQLKRCYSGWCIDGEEYAAENFLKGGFVTGSFIVTEDQQQVILVLGT